MNATTRRPNIVMILTDDHAAHSISAYGSVVNQTPRIDEIGDAGWVFRQLPGHELPVLPQPSVDPRPEPTATSTASRPYGPRSTPSQPTFITQLGDAGYKTAMIGKWHMGHGEDHNPQGFDYWDVVIDQGEYWNPRFLSEDGIRNVEGYATDIITDLATSWVESLDGDDPWCVLIYHKAPHRSWEPDEAQAAVRRPVPIPKTFFDDYASRSGVQPAAAMRVADHLSAVDLKQDLPEGLSYDELAVWKYQRFMQDYLACVASVDDNVGRVIDWLRPRRLFDDTLLMYASDQGFFLGDHGWFDKRLMYEESLRMPFLLSYPRQVQAGQRVRRHRHQRRHGPNDPRRRRRRAPPHGCRAAASGPT